MNQPKGATLMELLKTIGEPYTGNLYVRFDEGGGIKPPPLLYCFNYSCGTSTFDGEEKFCKVENCDSEKIVTLKSRL